MGYSSSPAPVTAVQAASTQPNQVAAGGGQAAGVNTMPRTGGGDPSAPGLPILPIIGALALLLLGGITRALNMIIR